MSSGSNFIVWGLSGGISVYKSLDMIHSLCKEGKTVQVVMTENACKFVSPMTLEALTGREVITDTFDNPMSHIDIADKADLFIIAPATYNIIGKLAGGIADDGLTSIAAAIRCDRFIAPAMNTFMYSNPALQKNLSILESYGYEIIEPDDGELACGYDGVGRLRSGDDILSRIHSALSYESALSYLSGKKVLVTAGSTREPIDIVRYIGNWSSGKMGMSFVDACVRYGADTVLVHGYMDVALNSGAHSIFAGTAKEMLEVLERELSSVDILIMCAAVGDYSPILSFDRKLKKGEITNLELGLNPDILKELASIKRGSQVFVGFAAESDDIVNKASAKLKSKGLDMILANDISRGEIGFSSDENELILITSSGVFKELPRSSKDALGILVLKELGGLFFSS